MPWAGKPAAGETRVVTSPRSPVRIGTAGWNVPRIHAGAFPTGGSHLARYAALLGAAEINTSFYRPHRPATYERWAASVPAGFRFAVKVPKSITHERRLREAGDLFRAFLAEAGGLGPALGPLLVQLPPSFAFDDEAAGGLRDLRGLFEGTMVCEPRHASWFAAAADALLVDLRIARVAADPAPVPQAAAPGGWRGLTYVRLHGSPRIYHSAYGEERLRPTADRLMADAADGAEAWCILDNTASFAALGDALRLRDLVAAGVD